VTSQTFEGGCHCGRVRFRVTAELSRVTDCNCSVCRKKGFVHLIVPPEQFELLSGKDALTTYRFNTARQSILFARLAAFIRSTCRVPIPTKSTSMFAASTASIWALSKSPRSTAAIGSSR
jgi:hypothetical protein